MHCFIYEARDLLEVEFCITIHEEDLFCYPKHETGSKVIRNNFETHEGITLLYSLLVLQ